MNESLRWKLCLGCLLVAALELPHVGMLVLQDLSGPYSMGATGATSAPGHVAVRSEAPRRSAALAAAVQKPLLDAGLLVILSSNRYLGESGNDFDSIGDRTGGFVATSH